MWTWIEATWHEFFDLSWIKTTWHELINWLQTKRDDNDDWPSGTT